MTLSIPHIKERIYLDHAATTPLDARVREAMLPYLGEKFGNPGGIYREGREAKAAVAAAREKVAELLSVKAEEIIFTGSGTESDNLGVAGITRAARAAGKGTHIITSAIEHHAVLHTCRALEKEGFAVTYLPIDEFGLVRPDDLKNALTDKTVLVSIMLANNEIGTIEPIKELASLAHTRGALFHTDACQASGSLDIRPGELGVDALTLNGSKIYGPKGVGALYIKSGVAIEPIIHGGGQERGLRSGTENVANIVGFARALEIAQAEREKESARLTELRDYFIKELLARLPGTRLNGHATQRLPNNVHISIPDIDAEAVLGFLDEFGVAAASGSACTATSLEPSHVVLALGLPYNLVGGSLRFTLGHDTARQKIDYVLEHLPAIVDELKKSR